MMRVELLTVVFRIKFSTMTKDNFCIVIPTTDKRIIIILIDYKRLTRTIFKLVKQLINSQASASAG